MLPTVNIGIAQTSIAGGTDGTPFNDLQTVGGWPGNNKIDPAHPIQKIEMLHGWVCDSLDVTYQLKDGTTQKVRHGSPFDPRSTVTLTAEEIITDVYGKAGLNPYYNKTILNQISFVILNTKTGIARIAGPFGNGNGSNAGNVFHASGPIAFAGYETHGPQLGISGLSIIRSDSWE